METKLELKHLSPYLPYDLKVWCSKTDIRFIMHQVGGTSRIGISELVNSPDLYKPILRPIYDLKSGLLNLIQGRNLEIELDVYNLSWTIEDSESYYPSGSYEIPFELWRGNYEKLLENHFDVFGLINKGWAIDINTLPSPKQTG